MKKALPAVLAAAGLALAACGGTTVDSEDVTTTAPKPSTSASPTTSATQAPAAPAEEPVDQVEGEGPASEISEAPADEPMRPAEDEAYLEALRQSGVNVDGNEEQLISTARTICEGDAITRDAVAGQLIEQERTTLGHEELTKLIDASAHSHICR